MYKELKKPLKNVKLVDAKSNKVYKYFESQKTHKQLVFIVSYS